MQKIKVMTVFGTRPEAIKMAPLVLKLKKDDRFEEVTVVSAQHRECLIKCLIFLILNLIMTSISCIRIRLWKKLLLR